MLELPEEYVDEKIKTNLHLVILEKERIKISTYFAFEFSFRVLARILIIHARLHLSSRQTMTRIFGLERRAAGGDEQFAPLGNRCSRRRTEFE